MSKSLQNVVIVIGLVGFGVFFGIDTAGRGVEQIQGPMQTPAATVVAPAATPAPTPSPAPTPAPEQTVQQLSEPASASMPHGNVQPKMTVIADKTGGVVQSAAQGGVELVVSLFEGLLN